MKDVVYCTFKHYQIFIDTTILFVNICTSRWFPGQQEMMMKKLIFVLGLLASGAAWAACSTHTYVMNGRIVTCTTCCFGGNCTTNCF